MIIIQTIVVLGFVAFWVYATFASSYEIDARRKNWRAGTHDYYGNKLK